MDVFNIDQRSAIMRRVRSDGTQPEIAVRRLLRQMKVSYRSCASNLPGKPDLVVAGQHKVIFVHGCFWHGHSCGAGKLPKSNRSYWKHKQMRNILRDSKNARALRLLGWKRKVLWECEIRNQKSLHARLARFLAVQT